MAITRYDQPARQEFMNTYVPIPFEELAQASQAAEQRWDQNMATTAMLESQFGNWKHLKEVTDPFTGEKFSTGDKERLDALDKELRARIDALNKEGVNLADPKVTRELMSVASRISREKGQDGVIGAAERRYNTYAEIAKAKREAEHATGLNQFYAYGVNKDLANYARALKAGDPAADLLYQGTIASEVDVNKELNSLLKSVRDSYIDAKFGPKGAPAGYNRQEIIKGLSQDDAIQHARNVLNSPGSSLDNTISLMAKDTAERTGENYTKVYNAIKESIAQRIGTLHARDSRSVTFKDDPFYLHSWKKQQDEPDPFTMDFAFGKQAPVKWDQDMVREMTQKYNREYENSQANLKSFLTDNGIKTVADNGKNKYMDANGLDRSLEVDRMQRMVESAKAKVGRVEHIKRAALKKAGLPDNYFQTDTYKTLYSNAYKALDSGFPLLSDEQLKNLEESGVGGLESFIIKGMKAFQAWREWKTPTGNDKKTTLLKNIAHYYLQGLRGDELRKKSIEATIPAVLDDPLVRDYSQANGAFGFISNNLAHVKYVNALEDLDETQAIQIPVTEFSSKLKRSDFISKISTYLGGFKSGTITAVDANTGESITGEDDLNSLDFQKGEVRGWFFDDTNDGKLSILHYVPGVKGEETESSRFIKVEAPDQLLATLAADGSMDSMDLFKKAVYDRMFTPEGPLNSENITGEGTLSLPLGKEESLNFDISTPMPGTTGENNPNAIEVDGVKYNYHTSVKNQLGEDVYIVANTMDSLIDQILTLYQMKIK